MTTAVVGRLARHQLDWIGLGVIFLVSFAMFGVARYVTKARWSQATRPKVVPLRFGNAASGGLFERGLFLTNDGEPAYDLTIDPFTVGRHVVSFEGKERLAKGEEAFCGVTISEHGALLRTNLGNLLAESMQTTGDWNVAIPFRIRYRAFDDAHATWVSICEFSRDVLKGNAISVRFVRQEEVHAQHA